MALRLPHRALVNEYNQEGARVLSLQVQGILNTGSMSVEVPVGALMCLQLDGQFLPLAATQAGGGLASFEQTVGGGSSKAGSHIVTAAGYPG